MTALLSFTPHSEMRIPKSALAPLSLLIYAGKRRKNFCLGTYEVVGQVLGLLPRQGRVSYRALKRQFDLDDAYIEDLKAEITQAQRLALDEDVAVLVRTGKTEGTSVSASRPAQTSEQATTVLEA